LNSYGAKFRDRSGEIKMRRLEGENAIAVINMLAADYTVTEVLSVKPFDAFFEMVAAANP
jgi:hypothetical protein